TFTGSIGATTALTSVTTDAAGTTAIGGNVSTTGLQSYGDAVTLGGTAVLASSGSGAVTFGSTVNGGSNLTVNTAGVTTFSGVVGGITALASLTTDAPGSTNLNGGTYTTTGNQTFNDPVSLGAETINNGANVSYGSTVSSPYNGLWSYD